MVTQYGVPRRSLRRRVAMTQKQARGPRRRVVVFSLMGWRAPALLLSILLVGCQGKRAPGPQPTAPSVGSAHATLALPPPMARATRSPLPPVSAPAAAEAASEPEPTDRKSIYQSRARATFTKTVVVGNSSDGARHVSGLRPGFRSCFLHEVERDPEAQGWLAVSIVLKGNGAVLRVDAKPTGRLSAQLVACCRARTRVIPYSPPEDQQPASLSFVVTFERLPADDAAAR